jgi:serine/threonine protein kinase
MATKFCPQCQQTYHEPQRFCLTDGELLSLRDPYNLVGRTIVEKYQVKALIGIGGMGVVYNAQHLSLDRRVALKILQPNIALKNTHTLGLFQKEARLAARLLHENIVWVMDAGQTSDDIAYMVMEWLDGRTLDEELLASGPLSIERTTKILRQIVAALKEAHAQHIVHRDLKPSNVMLIKRSAEQDVVKVLDFGIAKLVNDTMGSPVSQVMGTPHYASPEQLQVGGRIDGRSDVYSLGVMLFEMLTGKLPFNASSFQSLARLHLTEAPPPIRRLRPEFPAALEQLINRLLAKEPEQRPQIADAPALFEQAFGNIYELAGKERQAPGIDETPTEKLRDKDRQKELEQTEKVESLIGKQEIARARVAAEALAEKLKRPDQSESTQSSSHPQSEPAPGRLGAEPAPGRLGAEPAPGRLGAEPAPGRLGAESAPRRQAPNAKIKWIVGACIMALAGVILVYGLTQLNSKEPPSTDGVGSASNNTPTPTPTPQSANNSTSLRPEQIRDIDNLAVFTLDAPPFRADTAVPIQGASQEFKLNMFSLQPNNITDTDNWFESNQLPRPPEVLLPIQSADTAYQNLPKAIPRTWQGKKLITAITQKDRGLLIYGDVYYDALLLASLNLSTKAFEYGLDFKNYGYAPENIPAEREFTHQYIQWASQVDDVLYVSHGHNTYARSSKGMTGYVTAINVKDNRVLWSSPALISNARNFEIIDDYIVTGYGFTEEPDFLYVLRRKTGDVTQKIKLKSGPEYIIRKNNDIYVRTYDTDYLFEIRRKN